MNRPSTQIIGDIRLTAESKGDITAKHIELLEAIDALGTISAAARRQGISYRSAWDAVDRMNNLWDSALVTKQPGGTQGGGTHLTEQGRRLIDSFRQLQEEYRCFTESLNHNLFDIARYQQINRRFALRTSARNQFQGRVDMINIGPVNAEVSLTINEQDRLTAIITSESVEQLGLSLGSEVYALIKASFIILTPADDSLITSARNRLCGTLRELRHGSVNSEAIIELEGGKTLSAIITEETAKGMALEQGSRVCALVKACHVILGVN
jgi:molybdate transport system regulatory protein